VRARLLINAIRLQNISASSSRARVCATWTRHATSAVRLGCATSPITAASAAAASPAKSAIFGSAIPSTHPRAPPSESTHRRCATWPRKFDHDAFPAARFKASNPLSPSTTSTRLFTRSTSGWRIRATIPENIPAFTSALTRVAIPSSVENAGSSKPSRTSTSNATLIRSGG